ncbi:MAG: ABC transporter ATP-binding protein [Spirochaetales bacterium]|nr:ABC transporter ATP-binding protein [Spirochaetales bacterium]
MSLSVTVSELNFSYGTTPILSRISHRFPAGKITGIVGHNGCGKSTLIKNILGYLKPEQGQISFGDDHSLSQHQISKIAGFVPQEIPAGLNTPAYDLILMGRLPHVTSRWAGFSRDDHKRVKRVIEQLGLTRMARKSVGHLSGGERQKILMGRALVQDTPVILLDEATANLDIHHTMEIMELIGELSRKQGVTVITVLHDLNLAAAYCDELLLMRKGQVCRTGTPAEVITGENLEKAYGAALPVRRDERGTPFILPGRDYSANQSHRG